MQSSNCQECHTDFVNLPPLMTMGALVQFAGIISYSEVIIFDLLFIIFAAFNAQNSQDLNHSASCCSHIAWNYISASYGPHFAGVEIARIGFHIYQLYGIRENPIINATVKTVNSVVVYTIPKHGDTHWINRHSQKLNLHKQPWHMNYSCLVPRSRINGSIYNWVLWFTITRYIHLMYLDHSLTLH